MRQKILGVLCVILMSLFFTFSSVAQSVQSLGGETYNVEDVIAKDDVVVLFWTTWCPYCAKEIKRVDGIHDSLDVKFLAINLQESEEKVKRFVSSMAMSEWMKQRIAIDVFGTIGSNYGIRGLPTFVYLRDGRIIKRSNFLELEKLEKIFKRK